MPLVRSSSAFLVLALPLVVGCVDARATVDDDAAERATLGGEQIVEPELLVLDDDLEGPVTAVPFRIDLPAPAVDDEPALLAFNGLGEGAFAIAGDVVTFGVRNDGGPARDVSVLVDVYRSTYAATHGEAPIGTWRSEPAPIGRDVIRTLEVRLPDGTDPARYALVARIVQEAAGPVVHAPAH